MENCKIEGEGNIFKLRKDYKYDMKGRNEVYWFVIKGSISHEYIDKYQISNSKLQIIIKLQLTKSETLQATGIETLARGVWVIWN